MSTATKPSYEEVVEGARQYREACCAAMRVLANASNAPRLMPKFTDELQRLGIEDGFGKRCDDVLKRAIAS
jgi:hypothetical protein